jgi:hypothetical protein
MRRHLSRRGVAAIDAAGGVNAAQFRPRDPDPRVGRSQRGEPIRALVYGRMSRARKGSWIAARAIDLASRWTGVPVELTLFDAPPEGSETPSLPRPLLIPTRWVIGPSQDDLRDLYAGSDLFVSAERRAGWSNTAAEAMACGAAVVCTRSGTEDFAIDGETAEVVPPWNAFLSRRSPAFLRATDGRRRLAERDGANLGSRGATRTESSGGSSRLVGGQLSPGGAWESSGRRGRRAAFCRRTPSAGRGRPPGRSSRAASWPARWWRQSAPSIVGGTLRGFERPSSGSVGGPGAGGREAIRAGHLIACPRFCDSDRRGHRPIALALPRGAPAVKKIDEFLLFGAFANALLLFRPAEIALNDGSARSEARAARRSGSGRSDRGGQAPACAPARGPEWFAWIWRGTLTPGFTDSHIHLVTRLRWEPWASRTGEGDRARGAPQV